MVAMSAQRAERLARNRAAIEAALGPAKFVVRGVREPRHPRESTSGKPQYVEVGRCSKCRAAWRTNLVDGALKKHSWGGKPCTGSYKQPLARATMAKGEHRPGQPWPKRMT